MNRLRRPPEPPAIDITWVSCRGVRSSLPFHTPCLYASVCVTSPARKNVQGRRVRTPTDRAGGENPEWEDERLRLHLPDDNDASFSPASPEQESAARNKKNTRAAVEDDGAGVLVVKFELKAEVAVLGDVLAASAVVPLSDLVADGRTRRVSYQLSTSSSPDARQHNGVISFSYAFQDGGDQQDEERRSDGDPVTPPACPVVSPASASCGMYPAIDWPSMEQLSTIYPPLMEQTTVYPPLTVTRSMYYSYASTPPETPAQLAARYPPLTRELSGRGIYPTVGVPDNGLYPTVDLDPVICYPPTMVPPCYGGGFGYPAVPDFDARCLYG